MRDSSESFSSFPCIDEVRALPHVAGFPDLRVLRPAPTAAQPPKPLPGFAGYRPGIASRRPQTDGAETALPGSHDDRSRVQRPIRRRVPQRPLLEQERFPWPSPSRYRLGTLLAPPRGGGIYDDACSGFTHVADRTVAHAPLRTRPLDHARGHRYQGPRHLPGPDSHRQAALNLSLRYVMSTIPSSQRQSSLGAHRAQVMETASVVRRQLFLSSRRHDAPSRRDALADSRAARILHPPAGTLHQSAAASSAMRKSSL